jgi:hypothetical protein
VQTPVGDLVGSGRGLQPIFVISSYNSKRNISLLGMAVT